MQLPTQEPDYTFPESTLFDQLAHLDLQEHDSSPRTVPERPQSARGDRLERELELVRQQKEKLQLGIGSAAPASNDGSAPSPSYSQSR